MLGFRRIRVFDPAATMLRAAVAVPAVAAGTAFGGPVVGGGGLFVAVAWFMHLARRDREQPSAVSMRLDAIEIDEIVVADDGITAAVRVGQGSVGRLRYNLRRNGVIALRPGWRRLPLLIAGDDRRYTWVEHGRCVELSAAEALGAASVVLHGVELQLEVLIGGLPSEQPRPLAVGFTSSNGSIQSWDPVIDPVLQPELAPPLERPGRRS